MIQLEFRNAVSDDLEMLARFVNRAYRGESSKKGWTTEADLLDGQRTDSGKLQEILNAAESRLLLGFSPNTQKLLVSCELKWLPDGALSLGMLTVDPERQGAGLAKLMLAEVEKNARHEGAHTIRMTAIHLRPELISYYERRGYRRTGQVYEFPEDPRFGQPKVAGLTLVELEKKITG